MAEQIKPNTTVERGFVDNGSLPQSPYASLVSALAAQTQSGLNLLQDTMEKEQKVVAEKLSSPLLTKEEINEIEQNAHFPVTQLLARNRKGIFLAEQERAAIEDDLATATDVVDARDRLVKHQARVLEGVNDAGIAAGVREHFADIGAPLLAEAAKRREVLREVGEREDVNGTMAAAAQKGGTYLSNVIIGAVRDQHMADPSKVSDLHTDAARTIANSYAENPDTADEAYQAIDTLLGTPGAIALESDKAKYLRVKDVIQNEEKKRNAAALTANNLTARERAAKHLAYDWVTKHPDEPLRADIFEALIENSKDPKATEKWLMDLKVQQGKGNVIDSKPYKRALATMKAAIAADAAADPVLAERRIGAFNRLATGVDPSVLDDESKAESTMSELASRAEQLATKEDQLIEQAVTNKTETLRKLAITGKAANAAGDVEKAAKIAKRMTDFKANPENRVLQREIVRADLLRHAESLGIDMQDDLLDLYP